MKMILFLMLLPIAGLAQKNYSQLLRQYMQEQVADKGFTGSVLVVKNDRVLLKAGYGMADREWNIPNGPKVKYRIGSISKQFTAFCILKLAEEGKLELEYRLSKYFPDFPKADSVTIKMLLNHGSGIFNMTDLSDYENISRLRWSKDSIIHYVAKKPYDFSPGTDFRYSNTGYFLLGYIVEKASGESFDHYLRHHILDPLGMKDTGVDSDDSVLSGRAQGYQDLGGRSIRCIFISMDWLLGCGQIYSTIDDLYAWEKAYTRNAVLTYSSRKMLFTPNRVHYAFGIGVDSFMNHARFWHSGDCPGFDTHASRFVDDGVYIIILSNNQSYVNRMKDEIGHILFDSPQYFAAQKKLFAEELASAKNELDKKKAIWQLNLIKAMQSTEIQDSAALLPYTGSFSRGLDFFIRGHSLYCRNASRGGERFRLRHISGNLYQLDENLQVEFDKDATGHTAGLKVFVREGYEGYWPTKAEMDKRLARWNENRDKAGQSPMPGSSRLETYAGIYAGGLEFYRQGAEFICKNVERGNRLYSLRYISGDLFQVDEILQVEFEKDQSGNVVSVKMLSGDGNESRKEKIR